MTTPTPKRISELDASDALLETDITAVVRPGSGLNTRKATVAQVLQPVRDELGTMASQNANNVAITGGTAVLSSVTTPSVTQAGTLALSATGANIITASTNGSERVRIDSAGNVGIGETSPARQLSISDATQSNIQLTTPGAGSTVTDGFQLQFDGNSNHIWGYENTPTLFGTNGTERMRITAAGNLLVNASANVTVTGGQVIGLSDYVIFSGGFGLASPFSQNIQIDITFANWGSNNVIAIFEVDYTSRQFGVNQGSGFVYGRVTARNTSSGATLNSISTTNISSDRSSLSVTAPSNYVTRLTFSNTDATDFARYAIKILPGTGNVVTDISAALV